VWLISWLEFRGMWPDGMPATATLSELKLTAEDVEIERSQAERERARERRRQRSVLLDDAAISLDEDSSEIVRRVLAGIAANPTTLAGRARVTKPKAVLVRSTGTGGNGGGGGGGGGGGWDRGLTDDQKTLIGMVGEISAYEWLDHQVGMTPFCWRSTYRSSRFAGDPGNDGLGFDFALPEGPKIHYYEVKATMGDGSDAAIEMSVGEARFARSQLRGRYNLLFVTNVLDSSERRFYLLPNPFAPDAVDLYRVRNRGFRFSFRL
jgi:hypothetical protein